jgi:hypothetical protein
MTIDDVLKWIAATNSEIIKEYHSCDKLIETERLRGAHRILNKLFEHILINIRLERIK